MSKHRVPQKHGVSDALSTETPCANAQPEVVGRIRQPTATAPCKNTQFTNQRHVSTTSSSNSHQCFERRLRLPCWLLESVCSRSIGSSQNKCPRSFRALCQQARGADLNAFRRRPNEESKQCSIRPTSRPLSGSPPELQHLPHIIPTWADNSTSAWAII